MKRITKRRICWPNPDATCLEGGCGYCNDFGYRSIQSILKYAADAGMVKNRFGDEQKEAFKAFSYGQSRGWPNIDKK